MASRPILVDTNLLVLLAVGLISPSHIKRHKRLQQYDEIDFRALEELIAASSGAIFCPNVSTETSNLVRYVAEPLRSRVGLVLAELIRRAEESLVPNRDAVDHPAYARLGLTDAVLLMLAARGATLVTDDLPLYLAAVAAGQEAINFAHVQARRPDFP
ncbi:PIN domain-containing protein [Jiella sp. M17.18]|uniref:PIN domain-containing protein n=1 Tax=Jiella sp. M17.18 TaxID=3234247 RepID=UPI0034DE1868